jgi:hypothetical protein
MNCSKQISLFLATLILLANLGLTLSVHYCHDEIASISLQLQEEPCLAKESSCCAKVLSHNSCCSNKIQKMHSSETIVNKGLQSIQKNEIKKNKIEIIID